MKGMLSMGRSPAPGSYGDFHRNSIYDPGIVNVGLSAPTSGTPFSGANAGSSGQITSARDPRSLQLGGKFYF
jgi:hypothetical protein